MPLKNVLVLHGPNLNLLGERPGDDPSLTLDGLNHLLQQKAAELGLELRTFQSNHEGELIDRLQADRNWADAVLISPDTLAHTSFSLREALVAVDKPAVEVHLSDIRRRESWRRKSVIKDVCAGQFVGKGSGSYLLALEKLAAGGSAGKKRGKTAGRGAASAPKAAPAKVVPIAAAKLLGRESATGPGKTLGGRDDVPQARALGRRDEASDSKMRRREDGSESKSLGRREDGSESKSLGRPEDGADSKTIGRREDVSDSKTIGRRAAPPESQSFGRDAQKTLGRGNEPVDSRSIGRSDAAADTGRRSSGAEVTKSLGRTAARREGREFLTRALVRQKISERLSGKLTPGGLAAWARAEWNKVQEGAAAEVGHRDELEDALQTLTLSTMAASRISDEQLLDLMAQLDG